MTNEKDNENEPKEGSEDRIEEIKKEAKEDASSYYSQEEEVKEDMKAEFEKPVEDPHKSKEDTSFLKALAFLGFGLAVFAVILIFFIIKDLDERVGGIGTTMNKVGSAVNELEGAIKPLKSDIEASLGNMQTAISQLQGNIGNLNQDVSALKSQFGDHERNLAIKELKRALVMVQEVSASGSAGMKAKSGQVISSIESLLNELSVGSVSAPAGTIVVKEAPVVEEAEEESAEEMEAPVEEEAAEETEEATKDHAAEASHSDSDDDELPSVEELLGE